MFFADDINSKGGNTNALNRHNNDRRNDRRATKNCALPNTCTLRRRCRHEIRLAIKVNACAADEAVVVNELAKMPGGRKWSQQ